MKNIKPYNRIVVVANHQRIKTLAKGIRGVIRNISYTPGIRKLLSEKALIEQGYGIVKLNLEYADIICKTTKKLKGCAYAASNGLWMIDPNDIKPLDREVLLANPDFALSLGSIKNPNTYDHFENIYENDGGGERS